MTDGQYPAWLEWDPDTQEWVTYLPVLNSPAPGGARPATLDTAAAPPPTAADAPHAEGTGATGRLLKANPLTRERKKK